jgi:hypothetical protein
LRLATTPGVRPYEPSLVAAVVVTLPKDLADLITSLQSPAAPGAEDEDAPVFFFFFSFNPRRVFLSPGRAGDCASCSCFVDFGSVRIRCGVALLLKAAAALLFDSFDVPPDNRGDTDSRDDTDSFLSSSSWSRSALLR